MAVKNFEDLKVWKQARQLTQEVYRLTKTEKFLKDFGLRDQIRRAAISVMSNIAEGLNVVEIKSSFSFSMLRKDRVGKCVLNFTWRSIKNTRQRTTARSCCNHLSVCLA